jgi:hypothetical protein
MASHLEIAAMLLPGPAMDRFKTEMAVWLDKDDEKKFVIPR